MGILVIPKYPGVKGEAITFPCLVYSLINFLFQYIHDGSDTTEDSLVLVARTAGLEWPDKDKTSVPASLRLEVTPVNDAIPRLVNNTGLVVAAGSSALLTSYNLTFTTNAPDQSLNLR